MRNPIRNINAPQYQAKRSLPDHFQKCIFVNEGDTERGGLVALRRAHVVAGDNMGPSKRDKAASLGIPLVDEDTFLKMIGE